MKNDWHLINLACPKCQGYVHIIAVSVSADGEWLFDLFCPECVIKLQWVTTGAKMILKALATDMENCECKKEEHNPVKPPLKPKQITSQSDKDFLKDMGIEGGLE